MKFRPEVLVSESSASSIQEGAPVMPIVTCP